MNRRLRIYVVKREHVIIFPNDLRWNFALRDSLEDRHPIRTIREVIA